MRGDRHSKQAGVGILISVTAVGVSHVANHEMWQSVLSRWGVCTSIGRKVWNRAKVVEQWALRLEAMNKQLPHLGPPW